MNRSSTSRKRTAKQNASTHTKVNALPAPNINKTNLPLPISVNDIQIQPNFADDTPKQSEMPLDYDPSLWAPSDFAKFA